MPRLPIWELATLVHPHSDPWKLMALLHVYIDESGIHAGSPVTAVAGFIGYAETWRSVESKWIEALAVLEDAGVKAFRAYDCQNGEGEFQGIQREIRDALANRLARILAEHDLFGIWCSVLTQDWESASIPKAFEKEFPKPFYLCFATVAQKLANWGARRTDNASMALVYAEHEEFAGRAGEIWDAYNRRKRRSHLSSFTTASPRDCVPLQSADLLAYEMNQFWQEREYRPDPSPLAIRERMPFHILREGRGVDFSGCYDANALQAAFQRFKETGDI